MYISRHDIIEAGVKSRGRVKRGASSQARERFVQAFPPFMVYFRILSKSFVYLHQVNV